MGWRCFRAILAALTLVQAVQAQDAPLPLVRIDDAAIVIDGYLNEPVWATIKPVENFVTLEPDTLAPGRHATRLYLAYDKRGLYIGARMDQPLDTLVARLSGRDGFTLNRDSLSVTVDTSGDGRYGYWFGINLGDSLMDGTVLPERKYSNDWDGPWRGRSQTTETGWSAEMFIPWSAVSMPHAGDIRHMGLYVSRKVAYLDERWGWPTLPPTRQKFMSVLQAVEMRGVAPRQQYNIYPFAAITQDRAEDDMRYRAGVDLFWRPSTNFQLNGTINPDFGNVESDEVVINLSALEVFFPEKRLFFLEGQEVYVTSPRADTRDRGVGNKGAPYTLLNTRRIGGSPRLPALPDGVTLPQREEVEPTDLLGAFNVTGQVGQFRYGLLSALEDDIKLHYTVNGVRRNEHVSGNDYGVARLLYENTDAGAYRAVGVMTTAVLNDSRDAFTTGVDGHYLSADGALKLDAQYMGSDLEGEQRGHGGFIDAEVLLRQGVFYRAGFEIFDSNIDVNDLGFLQRNDMVRLRNSFTWTSSGLGFARENQFDVRGFYQRKVSESLFTGAALFFSDRLALNDLSSVTARLGWQPSFYDDVNSFGNGIFRIDSHVEGSLLWESDTTRTWYFTSGAGFREENLGGMSWTADASVGWRPSDRFGVTLNAHFEDRNGWLLHQDDRLMATFDATQWQPGLAVDYFISARQQLRFSLQYVGVRAREKAFYQVPGEHGRLEVIGKPVGPGFRSSYDFSVAQYTMQLRYRWEIAPLSDLFIVYTRQADRAALLRDEDFTDVFQDAWDDPLVDTVVVKLRYRLGS